MPNAAAILLAVCGFTASGMVQLPRDLGFSKKGVSMPGGMALDAAIK